MEQTSNRQFSVLSDDKEVIREIERLLPQEKVSFLVGQLTLDKVYDQFFGDQFELLRQKFGEIGFEVKNKKLIKDFLRFKMRFLDLDEVLLTDFGLEPHFHQYSIHQKRKGQPEYTKLIGNLKKLVTDFQVAYIDLLNNSRSLLSADDSISTRQGSLPAIQKDAEGNYSLFGKLIVMPQNTLYYHVFDIVVSLANPQNGQITFVEIQEELAKRIRKGKVTNISKRDAVLDSRRLEIKRIQNAIGKEQLFKLARIDGDQFKNELMDGREIIESFRGKGYKLNNPRY